MKTKLISASSNQSFDNSCNDAALLGYVPLGDIKLIYQHSVDIIFVFQQWIKFETHEEQVMFEQRMIHV